MMEFMEDPDSDYGQQNMVRIALKRPGDQDINTQNSEEGMRKGPLYKPIKPLRHNRWGDAGALAVWREPGYMMAVVKAR